MSGGAGARTAAVVVAYESGPALARCAADLADAGVAELVVVDNGSADGSVAAAAAGAPGLMPVTPGRNLGYGSAANRGVAATTAPYVLVCNPDLEVPPDALDALAAALDADPARAVAGPLVRTPGGDRYPSARHFPSLVDAAGHAVLGLFRPDNRFTRAYQRTELDAAMLLALQAAVRKDAGQKFTREASMAKLFASTVANKAANEAVQILGGYGYTKEFVVEKLMRDAKLLQIYEGTSQIQRLVIARDMVRNAG